MGRKHKSLQSLLRTGVYEYEQSHGEPTSESPITGFHEAARTPNVCVPGLADTAFGRFRTFRAQSVGLRLRAHALVLRDTSPAFRVGVDFGVVNRFIIPCRVLQQ